LVSPRVEPSARFTILNLVGAGLLFLTFGKQCTAQTSPLPTGLSRYVADLVETDAADILKINDLNAEAAVESDNLGEFCFPPILEDATDGASSFAGLKAMQNPSAGVNSDQHPATPPPSSPAIVPASPLLRAQDQRFHWRAAILQSFYFTALMNAWRIAVEPSTRKDLKGPFWPDYFDSVKSLRGWRDGDEFYVNYLGHPMQGAVSGFIQIQNDDRGRDLQISGNSEYWKSRLRAMGWATLISCQFELGPFGEASIGNVGLKPSPKSRHPMAYVDLVVTPTIGTAWLVGEDIVDKYLILKIESRVSNRYLRALVRTFLNPSRSFANLFRGQWLWYRDKRNL
jgi:hypothetical protein